MIVGILLFQAVAFAVLSGIVAHRKKRDPMGWGFIGFLFGIFGFVAALVVEEVEPAKEKNSNNTKRPSSSTQGFNPDEHEKKCPMCAEYIKLEARRCKHCGHEMSEEEVEQQIEEAKKEMRKGGTEAGRTDRSSTEGKATATQKSEDEPTGTDAVWAQIAITVIVLIIILAVALST